MEIYFDAHSIELLLNGKRIGKKKCRACKAAFQVVYAAGTLEAIAYDKKGREIARNQLKSASGELRLRVVPEENEIKTGEIAYVAVDIADMSGIVESNTDVKLKLTVENGILLGFGSARPKTEERYLDGSFTTWYGQAQAVVRASRPGKLTVRVSGGGMIGSGEINVIE